MHSFVDGGKHLVIFDAFGLTRITLPKKVKSDKNLSGLWLSACGPLALVHSERSNTRAARMLPDLKTTKVASSYSAAAVLPDGNIITPQGSGLFAAETPAGARLWQTSLATNAKGVSLALGPALVPASYERTLWTGEDGAVVLREAGTFYGGTISDLASGTVVDRWCAEGDSPQGVVRVLPNKSRTFVASFHTREQRAYCSVIDSQGAVSKRTVDTIATPSFANGRVVYQTGAAEIVREPFSADGAVASASGAAERFAIPANVRGAGEVCACGDAIFFISPDRERVVDVVTGTVIERGLPPADKNMRDEYLAFLATLEPAAREANTTLFLRSVSPPAYGGGARPGWSWDAGDYSLLHYVVIGNLIHRARNSDGRRLSPGSWSNTSELRADSVDDVARMLAVIDAHALDAVVGIGFADTALKEAWGGSFNRGKLVDHKPALTRDAALLALRAMLEHARAPGSKLAPHVDEWRRAPLTPASIIELIDPSAVDSGDRWFQAQTAAAWLVLEIFRADALPVLIDWLLKRPSGYVKSNMHIIGDVAERMVLQFPSTKAAWDAARSG